MKSFFWYRFWFIFTAPGRWIMQMLSLFVAFLPNFLKNKVEFDNVGWCIRYLFGTNPYVNNWIYSQIELETGDFKSARYMRDHNCYGMGYVPGRKYQSARRASNVTDGTEPTYFAVYKSDSHSIYDYYYELYNHKRKIYDALYETTLTLNSNWDAKSNQNQWYVGVIAGHFRAYGWFTAPLQRYYSNVLSHQYNNNLHTVGYSVSYVISSLLYIAFAVLIIYIYLRAAIKKPS